MKRLGVRADGTALSTAATATGKNYHLNGVNGINAIEWEW